MHWLKFKQLQEIWSNSVVVFKTELGYLTSELNKNEPRHDKTNKMSVRPAKTQNSLGIHPV